MACAFRALTGPFKGKLFPVDPGRKLLVGSAHEADFTIPDERLKPFHCEITFDEGHESRMAKVRALADDAFLVMDGVPMDELLLQHGDRFLLGESLFELMEDGKRGSSLSGRRTKEDGRCAACREKAEAGLGRRLFGRTFCWRCVDLRLTVRREMGRYRILRKIRREPAEVTYAAEDLSKEPPVRVALHVLKAERHADARVLRRFLTKTLFAFALQHPVFARTRDLVSTSELASYVTDLRDWPTLEERILERRGLPLGMSVKIAVQLADALRYARGRGMIVGRLRANRLLVSDEGQVEILDYWLRHDVEEAVAAGIGAPAAVPLPPKHEESIEAGLDPALSSDLRRYLTPPEKDLQHAANEASDVRPIGLILYQLATGRYPGDDPVDALLKKLGEAHARRGGKSGGKLPTQLRRVLEGCLGPEAEQRYTTLAALQQDLKDSYLDL